MLLGKKKLNEKRLSERITIFPLFSYEGMRLGETLKNDSKRREGMREGRKTRTLPLRGTVEGKGGFHPKRKEGGRKGEKCRAVREGSRGIMG